GRGRAGAVPAVLRVHLSVLEQPAAAAAAHRLVSYRCDLEPDLVPDRGLSQPLHLRLGRDRAGARVRRGRRAVGRRAAGRRGRAAREVATHMRSVGARRRSGRTGGAWRVARAIAWRSLHTYVRRPDLFVPSLVFPLVFLASFAGGLSALASVPGFRFPAGYTAFQFVFVLCQSAMFSGPFTGFSLAVDVAC